MNTRGNSYFYAPEDAQLYIRNHPDTVILDIRTQREHAEQRIAGSIRLDFNEFSPGRVARLLPNKGITVLVYCRAGLHSKTAAATLRQYGYNAVDIGSVHDWSGAFEGTFCD